jgi:hypothetical protein
MTHNIKLFRMIRRNVAHIYGLFWLSSERCSFLDNLRYVSETYHTFYSRIWSQQRDLLYFVEISERICIEIVFQTTYPIQQIISMNISSFIL